MEIDQQHQENHWVRHAAHTRRVANLAITEPRAPNASIADFLCLLVVAFCRFSVQFLILCLHVEELNAFFLKHLLWIPPESKLNVVRLGIWAFVGTPCLRQIYTYMTDPNCKRIGHQTFLCSLVIITECIVIAKFGQHDEFTRDMPTNIRNGQHDEHTHTHEARETPPVEAAVSLCGLLVLLCPGLIVFMVGYLAILVVLALRTQRTPEMEKSGSGTKLVKTHSQ